MTQVNDTGVVGPSAPPVANRAVVAGELKRALASRHRNQLSAVLMLRATPEWHDGDPAFVADLGAVRAPVTVAPCRTVLAVLAALAADREDGRYLVILTPQETADLGDSVLARAMLPMVKPVNRWDLVLDAFGARLLDPALSRSKSGWVAAALLDVQPDGGWRRLTGEMLTRATALNRLAAARLGIELKGEAIPMSCIGSLRRNYRNSRPFFLTVTVLALAGLVALGFQLVAPASATNAAKPASAAAATVVHPAAAVAPVVNCAKLAALDFARAAPGAPTQITSAALTTVSGAQYCEVKGEQPPQLQFDLRLPVSTWTGRYVQEGCGGYCGAVSPGAPRP